MAKGLTKRLREGHASGRHRRLLLHSLFLFFLFGGDGGGGGVGSSSLLVRVLPFPVAVPCPGRVPMGAQLTHKRDERTQSPDERTQTQACRQTCDTNMLGKRVSQRVGLNLLLNTLTHAQTATVDARTRERERESVRVLSVGTYQRQR